MVVMREKVRERMSCWFVWTPEAWREVRHRKYAGEAGYGNLRILSFRVNLILALVMNAHT